MLAFLLDFFYFLEVLMRSAITGIFKNISGEFDREITLRMWRKMCESRYFELAFKKFVEETGNSIVKIPFYLSVGQESVSAALSIVFPEAILFPQHRCHDIYLAWGGDPEALADELIHFSSGCAGGKGGSASIHIPGKMIGHDGFMGTQVRDCVGRALQSKQACIAFMGDASAEEGYVLGAEGLAASRHAPILFVCLDNNLSILTKVKTRRSWTTENVAKSFGMESIEMTDDPWLIMQQFKNLRKFPAYFNIYVCRELWHAGTGKDNEPEWNRFELVKEELDRIGLCAIAGKIELDVKARMNGIWNRRLKEFRKTHIGIPKNVEQKKSLSRTSAQTIAEITRKHVLEKMGVVGGQCLTAVGWVGGTVPQLSEGDGLFETSMDDTSWPGIMVGMASKDFRPILIVRYQGFLWFNAEAIANRAAKSKYLWNEPRPVLVRAIAMDGGMGPVASGSHTSLLTRMPGLRVYAPMTPKEYEYGYREFMNYDDPMVFSEHRRAFQIDYEMEDIVLPMSDITIFAVSSTRLNVLEAWPVLAGEGIICNLIHVKWLKPFEITENMKLALAGSKCGLFLDGDFEYGHMRAMAYDLIMASGKQVYVLGLEERSAGFSPESDNLPPTKEKIIAKVKEILGK